MSGSISGAPKVTLTELDVSAGAATRGGAYVAMALIAPRGPIGEGRLITSEQDLVRYYTPESTVRPEYDTGFFVAIEALKKTDKLWITRAAEQPMTGGAFVRVAGAVAAGAADVGEPCERGFPNVDHYDITSADGRINPGAMVFSVDSDPGTLTIPPSAYSALSTGDQVQLTASGASALLPQPLLTATNYFVIKDDEANKIALAVNSMNASTDVRINITSVGTGALTLACAAKSLSAVAFTADIAADTITVTSSNYDLLVTGDKATVAAVSTNGSLPSGVVALTDYYVIKTPVVNKLQLAANLADAQNGVEINLTTKGAGVLELLFESISPTPAGQDKAILFYGSDGGSYGNNISFTITNYATNPAKVKEPGAFLLQLFYNGIALPRERWLCSFNPGHKDGNNQSIFVEDVLTRSELVRAQINPLLSGTNTSIADVLSPIPFSGGSDGLAITDSTMARALNVLNVPGRYPITFIIDGGWSTPAYQLFCISFAEQIGAAAAFIAPPYAIESTSNALNDVVSYYQNLGSTSSHAAIFSSHVQVLDLYNNRKLWISPVGNVAADYAYTFDQLAPGQPVGGDFGQISVLDVARHWSDGEMDYLYENNVNPIRFKLSKGIQIWGQKTLQSRPSDLDRMNARMLLMVIEPALRDAYEGFLFARNGVTNDDGTRRQVTVITDNYMRTIKARGGVYNWLTVCNDTNNSLQDVQNETLNVWLLVQIVKAVEYIPFTVCVTPTSVSLDIAKTLIAPGNK